MGEFAQRLTGSPDVFDRDGRATTASVNFISAHDGFTLCDVVTYDVKHNGANGESNRDGSDDNRSWNCGVEGETDDPHITALRHRQTKNLMATLVLATGVPMITAGDELGRTQQGNNNAYCQDSPISWVHWDTQHDWKDLADVTRKLLQLRADHPVLRREIYRRGEDLPDAKDGPRTAQPRLVRRAQRRDDGGGVAGRHPADAGYVRGQRRRPPDHRQAFLIWFHGESDAVQVHLPDGHWAHTTVVAHTGLDGELPEEKISRRLDTADSRPYGRGSPGRLTPVSAGS